MSEDSIVITGATSTIGKALVRQLAQQGYNLLLCARDLNELERVGKDAQIRFGITTKHYHFDALDTTQPFITQIFKENDHISGLICTQGTMQEDDGIHAAPKTAQNIITTNYLSVVHTINSFLTLCTTRGAFVAAITSVAGDRGKKRNLIYNSAKGGLSIYLEGARQAARHKKISVLDVRPGFIDTPLTYGRITFPFIATPQQAAKDIIHAIKKKKHVLYTPFYWRYIMTIIKWLPSVIYDRLKL